MHLVEGRRRPDLDRGGLDQRSLQVAHEVVLQIDGLRLLLRPRRAFDTADHGLDQLSER